jgi:hypothetical protein
LTANPQPELGSLLEQFVRVRLVQMGGVDLSVFQFDPLLSWSVFFMNADKTIYGRYGSASPATRRSEKDSNPNHSPAGLEAALRRALELHSEYTRDPRVLSVTLSGKTGPKPPWPTPSEFPSALEAGRIFRVENAEQADCIHCHEVQRSLIDSYFMTNREVTDNMLWLYPQPDTLGMKMSLDHCARVVEVAEGSIAARAGVLAGDDILTMDDQPLLSTADIQWVLQNFPDAGGKLPLLIRRKDADSKLQLDLPNLWRRDGDFGWRYRVAGYSSWLWLGATMEDGSRGVRVLHLSPPWFNAPNRDGVDKLRAGDLILEVDGESEWSRSTLISYMMREKALGSILQLKIERKGEVLDVGVRMPAERPKIMGH